MEQTQRPAAPPSKAPPRAKQGAKLIPWILRPGNRLLVLMQETLNRIYTPALNPLYFLGSITFLLFWILLGTGTYLYLFYEMNPVKAYESVRYLTEDQRYYGGIIRSLHRYASDAMVIVIAIHIGQVFFSDRFRRYRWVAWVSGAAILPVIWFEGVSGYFLVWDQTAQMIAIKSAELLNALHINADPVERNFLTNDSINSLLFFVMNYLHLALPCLMLILVWVHCMRISMPMVNPPWPLGITITAGLVALALVKPALSGPPADLSQLIVDAPIDWFFLAIFPLTHELDLSPGAAWIWGGAAYLLFALMPWVIREPKKNSKPLTTVPSNAITVNQDLCKGCLMCQLACPFEAIQVFDSGDPERARAIVTPNRCAECGFCVTACEFGAISMGEWTKSSFQNHITGLFGGANGGPVPTTMAFVCERAMDQSDFYTPDRRRLAFNPGVATMAVPCIGMVSPPLVEYAERAGAKGVVVVGCRALDCHYREARRRLNLHTSKDRALFLVEKMENPNLLVLHVSPLDLDELKDGINEFHDRMKQEVAP